MLSRVTAFTVALLVVASAAADTITVCWDGSGDYVTIQEGIDAAVDGDEVVVCDGTYTGVGNKDLDFGGKPITLRSENGPETCIIDCVGEGRGFHFQGGETADAVVEGFTISRGDAVNGGGISCTDGSTPQIVRCVIEFSNGGSGGGIYCRDSDPAIISCAIRYNRSTDTNHGGGIYCNYSDPVILNCRIDGNVADYGGGIYGLHSRPRIANCTFVGNTAASGGGGMYFSLSDPVITNCLITRNAATRGGGIYCFTSSSTLTNCILWDDTPEEIFVGSGDPSVTYCAIQGGWPGIGNIDVDPLFVDPVGPDGDAETWQDNDYHLSLGSPCIDAADNTAVPPDTADLDEDGDTSERTPLDLDLNPRFVDDPDTEDTGVADPPDYPEVVDMGAYEFQAERGCPGDLDGDDDTDQSDLGVLLSAWGINDGGDLDGDGDTDQADLGILLADWSCGT